MAEETKNIGYEKDSDYESMFGSSSDDDDYHENQYVGRTIQQHKLDRTGYSTVP